MTAPCDEPGLGHRVDRTASVYSDPKYQQPDKCP